jgi:hypothetical protein
MITRRHMLASSLCIPILATPDIAMSAVTLATCVIEVRGEWHAPPESAKTVIARMRDACLAGVELRSGHQPQGLWVQNNPSGLPSIWLHDTPADVAWIMVDVGERAWSQLAYQFGHECGHVAANSWERNAVGPPPSRWLEETLVEAFSLRGLGLLAESWAKAPPFPGDNAYGSALRDYRDTTLAQYRKRASEQGATDLLRWWKREEPKIDRDHGLGPFEQAAVPVILGLIEPEPLLIEDYQGLNLWPERSSLPLPDYLRKWQAGCRQIGAPARLPLVLADLLGVGLADKK